MADTSLMVIPPTMTGVILFAPGKADQVIAEIKEKARAEAAKLDISTRENREAIAALAYKIARTKTATDKMRLELVSDRKKELKLIDAEGARIWDELEALQKEVRQPLTDWENREKERIAKHETAIAELAEIGDRIALTWQMMPIDEMKVMPIGEMKAELSSIDERFPASHDWEEFGSRGALAVKTAKQKISEAIAKRETYDAEQAELVRLRAEAAERAQLEREEAAAAKAKAEAEEAARVAAIEAEARAKREAEQAAKRAEEEKQAAIKAEKERAERERKAEEEAERKRAANRAHAAKINNEAKACLLNHTNLTAENAEEAINAIAKGLVSHVSIQY